MALERHYLLLERWNRSLNLTAIRNLDEAVERHYAESLFLGVCLAQLPGWSSSAGIVDAGSGAGFPGFPIAILHAESTVTLVESHKRKAVFLSEAARELSNVRVKNSRLGEMAGTFDALVSRAVRWSEIAADAQRLSRAFGLLATSSEAWPAGTSLIQLPWSAQRVVVLGCSTWNAAQ